MIRPLVTYTVPARTESGNAGHGREHWRKRGKRVSVERTAAWAATLGARVERYLVSRSIPITFHLVRCSESILDDDNAVAGMKAVRDGIADALNRDDRSPDLNFAYSQRISTVPQVDVAVYAGLSGALHVARSLLLDRWPASARGRQWTVVEREP